MSHGQQYTGSNPFAYTFHQQGQNGQNDQWGQPGSLGQDQPPLMNTASQNYLDDFFNQPDQVSVGGAVPYDLEGYNLNDGSASESVDPFGFQTQNFMEIGNVHMTEIAAARPANSMGMAHLSHNDVSNGFHNFTVGNEHITTARSNQPIIHDQAAASALLSMSSNPQQHSQVAVAGGAGSWGYLNMGPSSAFSSDQLTNSPMASGGPSSGSTNGPHTPINFSNNVQRSGQASQAQRQAHMPVGNSRDHMSNNQVQQVPQWQMQQSAMGQGHSQRRPPIASYGSDQNFGQNGYQASGHSADNDKYHNLLNVPLAEQAAQTTPISRASLSAGQQTGGARGTIHRHSVPNSLQQLSNVAISQQYANQTQQRAYSDMQLDGASGEVQQSRKRRRSVEDDGAQSQTIHSNTNGVARRESLKNETNVNQPAVIPTPVTTNKRRKSTPRTSSGSPDAPTGSASKPAAAKKRRTDSKPKKTQNLTETEKRENHIRSEQKRRDAMKHNYDWLASMLPAGQAQNNSRADILQAIGDTVHDLISANQGIMSAYNLTEADLD